MNAPAPTHTSPKDFFLHLLSIVTLYVAAASLITLLFQLVNIYLPDPLANDSYMLDAARTLMRSSISFLIIMFPAYIATNYLLQREYRIDPAKVNLRIRKWLVYFTIFAAALIILGSLASLCNRLLEGELTLRFVLKLLSLVGVTSAIFGYYIWELRHYEINTEVKVS